MRSKTLSGVKVTRLRIIVLSAVVTDVALALTLTQVGGALAGANRHGDSGPATTTPIKHLVVIFQENVSFDHYFGVYPNATNPAGQPAFYPLPGTP